MAGRVVRETVTLAERAERARLARAFVEGVLGPGHPCGDVAALLVGELFSNSLRHSGSGAPGETVTVAVKTVNDVTTGGLFSHLAVQKPRVGRIGRPFA
jgi:anti-sigma regulatory factor (Ser/Thr protein kinase)